MLSHQPSNAQSKTTTIRTVYNKEPGEPSKDGKTSDEIQNINKRKCQSSEEVSNKKFKVKTVDEFDSVEKYIFKSVVIFLLGHKEGTIEDFLENTKDTIPPNGMPPINLELITKYGKFICEEVFYMVKFSNEKYMHIPSTPFIQKLNKSILKNEEIDRKCLEDKELEATSTPLIDALCSDISNYERNPPPDLLTIDLVFAKTFLQCISVTETTDKRIYHESLMIGSTKISSSQFVCVRINKILHVGKVAYFFINKEDCQKMVHLIWLLPGNETILGETADPREYFLSDKCANVKINDLKGIVSVSFNDSDADYFLSKKYESDTGRFVDISETDLMCPYGDHGKKPNIPSIQNSNSGKSVKWNDEEYSVGDCVFLMPNVLKSKESQSKSQFKKVQVDTSLYPEARRKTPKVESLRRPFCIGLITKIKTAEPICQQRSYSLRNRNNNIPEKISIEVLNFYRPENLHSDEFLKEDINEVFASNLVVKTKFSNVVRKCTVIYAQDLSDEEINTWTDDGPDRFYFKCAYDESTDKFVEPSEEFKHLKKDINEFNRLPSLKRALKCFDIFAGCGGLSEGLRQSGVADIKWAIDKDKAASRSFKINNPSATVFSGGCNTMLNSLKNGQLADEDGQCYPKKGDVELLCGGPPCQGFSKVNRFSSEFNSKVMNSLIVTFISYCDFYRPRYAIMENVKSLVSYKNSVVVKFIVRCLLKMGYQVAYRFLQAGSYGVPQGRKRFFVIAAAPGEVLPEFPAVTHAFLFENTCKSYSIGHMTFPLIPSRDILAPYRPVTVRDAISDLPFIRNGFNKTIEYASLPLSHFQRQLRNKDEIYLYDHVCKKVSPLMETRISLIPPGGDWRDLPNKCVKLSNGTTTKKLVYTYYEKNKGPPDAPTAVCRCVKGKKCHDDDKQWQTLIPWSLVHTANRNNNWQGAYGRLEYNGFFSTTMTNPDPMGKQGKILHPEQNRVLSVREYARSQGFPDSFQFYGLVAQKYNQIGNAVPPPLARAIGLELKKSLIVKEDIVDKPSDKPSIEGGETSLFLDSFGNF